jgi:hypothetical protein
MYKKYLIGKNSMFNTLKNEMSKVKYDPFESAVENVRYFLEHTYYLMSHLTFYKFKCCTVVTLLHRKKWLYKKG